MCSRRHALTPNAATALAPITEMLSTKSAQSFTVKDIWKPRGRRWRTSVRWARVESDPDQRANASRGLTTTPNLARGGRNGWRHSTTQDLREQMFTRAPLVAYMETTMSTKLQSGQGLDSLPPITVDTPEEREIFEGVKQTLYWWGRCLNGRDSVLLAHGLVTPDVMPGAPGQLKTVARGTVSGRAVTVRREGKHRLDVRIKFTDDDARAFCERDVALTAKRDADAEVQRLPGTAEAYRERAALVGRFVRRYMAELGTSPARLPVR